MSNWNDLKLFKTLQKSI